MEKKINLGERCPGENRTKECSLCWGAGNVPPPSAAWWVCDSISNRELVGKPNPVFWKLKGSWRARSYSFSSHLPSTWHLESDRKKYEAMGEKKQKPKRACSSFLQHVHQVLGRHMPLYMGSQVTATTNLHLYSNYYELLPPSLLFFSRQPRTVNP